MKPRPSTQPVRTSAAPQAPAVSRAGKGAVSPASGARGGAPVPRGASPQVATASVVQPWSTPTGLPSESKLIGGEGRPCVMTPAWVEAVAVAETGEWLPKVGQWTDDRRLSWKKFELPSTTKEGGDAAVDEQMLIRLYDGKRARGMVRVSIQHALPRLRRHSDAQPAESVAQSNESAASPGATPPVEPTHWHRAAEIAHRMVDSHVELIARLSESTGRDEETFHDGPGGGTPIWPLGRVLDMWRSMNDHESARPPLIVQMARTLSQLLTEVCTQPRQILTRQRRLQNAGRIAEVDADCLRWLARQPGKTVAEKAGAKQRAMGIARVEHADTLENRLVRDLVRRSISACDAYLAEHAPVGAVAGAADADSDVSAVSKFSLTLQQLWRTSPIANVGALAGLPRPNHALQHDRRYKAIWKAYVMLVRQQVEQDQAWRWRHRMWAEACLLALLASLAEVSPRASALQSDVLLRAGQLCGRSIDERSGLGRFDVIHKDAGSTIMLITGDQIPDYRAVAPFPEELQRMSPDAVLICREAQWPDKPPRQVMAVWTMLDFDLNSDELAERASRIDVGLRLIRSASKLSGLVIQPAIGGRAAATIDAGTCRGLRVTLPLQPHVSQLAEHIVKEFGLR